MSFLDLYQGDQQQAMRPQANEGHDLPATFGESFQASWDYGRMFSASNAGENARLGALQDYTDDIRARTGKDLAQNLDWDAMAQGGASSAFMLDGITAQVKKLNAGRAPGDELPTIDGDELERRAVEKSRAAGKTLADVSGREHSGLGEFAGGIASAATDPINLIGLAATPELASVGIVAQALKFGAAAAVSQAVIEAAGAGFHEEVKPGYLQSAEPLGNIAEAFGSGAVLGGATRVLGNLWSRFKSPDLPTSVKDAGNVFESEANVADHNVYPDAAGEAAHRDAMASSIDQVLKGEPVDVSKIITPDIEASARDLTARLEREQGAALPAFNERAIALTSEEAGLRARATEIEQQAPEITETNTTAADRLNRLQAVEQQLQDAEGDARKQLLERRDQILVDTTPEQLQADAAPIEQARRLDAERQQIGTRLAEIENERTQARAEALGTPQAMIGQREPVRPADVPAFEPREKPAVAPPDQARATVESADHEQALAADVDRERVADIKAQVPVGLDDKGQPIFRSLDDLQGEAEAYRKVADQIAACAAPVEEPAANG